MAGCNHPTCQSFLETRTYHTFWRPGWPCQPIESSAAFSQPIQSCFTHPAQLFSTNYLGQVYWQRSEGERRENLEQAIACYQEALRIFTPQTSPDFYALLQQNLGEAYQHRLAGNRQEN